MTKRQPQGGSDRIQRDLLPITRGARHSLDPAPLLEELLELGVALSHLELELPVLFARELRKETVGGGSERDTVTPHGQRCELEERG